MSSSRWTGVFWTLPTAATVAVVSLFGSLEAAPPLKADIAPSALTLGSATLSSGGTTQLKLTVGNLGGSTARSVAVAISIATAATTSRVASFDLGTLSPGASGTVSTTLTAPTQSGAYTVIATATMKGSEGNTANNTTTTKLTVATSSISDSTSSTSSSSSTSTSTSSGSSEPTSSTPCDHYASPTGGGSGSSASSPFRVTDFWAVAAPGRTLCLVDGIYRGTASMIDPPDNLHGAAGKPITVRALTDGRVFIDGERTRQPALLKYNDYYVLEGFNAANSSGSVISVVRSNHVVVRRVAAWDAADSNHNIFSTSSSEYVLFEDVAGWGVARKTFSASQGGNYVTCRRCWGRWEGSHVVGPKMTYTLAYNSYHMTIENSIGTWSGERMKESYTLLAYDGTPWTGNGAGLYTNYAVDQPYGIFAVDRLDNDKNANSKILGSIAYVTASDRFAPPRLFFSTNIDAVEMTNNAACIQPGTHTSKRAFALYGLNGGTATNLTARSLTGIASPSAYIDAQWDASDIELGETSLKVDSIFAGSYGAQVCTRYKDRVLTSEPLWPWPMNQRIIDATLQSGRKAVDVTATIESLFGPIPAYCKK